MLIIWSGRGWIVPLLNVVAFVGYAFSLQPFYHTETSALLNVATVGACAALWGGAAAAAIYFVAKRIESAPARVLIDKETGREIKLRKTAGTFFFVPTRIWPFVTVAIWGLVAIGGIAGGELLAGTATAR